VKVFYLGLSGVLSLSAHGFTIPFDIKVFTPSTISTILLNSLSKSLLLIHDPDIKVPRGREKGRPDAQVPLARACFR